MRPAIRYSALAAWGAVWLLPVYLHNASGVGDWDVFVYAGRVLLGLHPPAHSFSALHLYAEHPNIQSGPPALIVAGAMSWASRSHSEFLVTVLLVALGVAVIWTAEHVGRVSARRCMTAGVVMLPFWGVGFGSYRHLDDALALAAVSGAFWLLRVADKSFPAAVLLGFAAATKPWAVVAAPILLSAPRRFWLQAGVAFTVSGLVWWVPFVAADHSTLPAVSSFRVPVSRSSLLHLLGARGNAPAWVRPVQFYLGAVACAAGALRQRMALGLLAAFVLRLVLDPANYVYYGLAPLLAAITVDLSRGRGYYWTTAAVAGVYVGDIAGAQAVTSLVLFVAAACAATAARMHTAGAADHRQIPRATRGDLDACHQELSR